MNILWFEFMILLIGFTGKTCRGLFLTGQASWLARALNNYYYYYFIIIYILYICIYIQFKVLGVSVIYVIVQGDKLYFIKKKGKLKLHKILAPNDN